MKITMAHDIMLLSILLDPKHRSLQHTGFKQKQDALENSMHSQNICPQDFKIAPLFPGFYSCLYTNSHRDTHCWHATYAPMHNMKHLVHFETLYYIDGKPVS
uniref:Uncharacterized protein n=1 Tax=Micrurus spixii TaxID=129469 RepID=A0A2D4N412_9SAUR